MFSYKNKNILIVDDQKAFHVMLKTMLTNQGAKARNITFAEGADAAVKLAQSTAFNIFLIDYNLGAGKNGVQLIDYLRNNKLIPNDALCFIITGDNNRGMVLSAIEKSPDDYLMKPIDYDRFLEKIQNNLKIEWVYEGLIGFSEQPGEMLEEICKRPSARNIEEFLKLGKIGHVRAIQSKIDDVEKEFPECSHFLAILRGHLNDFQLTRFMTALEHDHE